MNQANSLPKLDPLDIVIFHVGGVGGYGPVKKVIERFPRRTVIICFEANPSPKDLLVQKKYADKGVRTVFVPKCIGAVRGKQQFYVNKHPASSSIFPPSPEVSDNHILGLAKGVYTWGENCEVDHTVELETVTLDDLMAEGSIPHPDILSMDTQGSEMPIMRGGLRALGETLSVVCEVDFIELYQGQDTFPAQHQFLSEQGFRIADLLNTQYWHPGPAAGLGFLTMGEAVYFRKLQGSALPLPKLIKLAAIAYAFGRTSYSSTIVTLALERFGSEAEKLLLVEPAFKPILDIQRFMKDNHANYLEDNTFFYRRSWGERAASLIDRAQRSARRALGPFLGPVWRYAKQRFKSFARGGGKARA